MDEYDEKWIARVMARTVPGESGCVLWQGNVNRKGYGQTVYRGRTRMVHRKLFELRNGLTLDRWTFVCHHCDTPNCVAIGHLWRGTPKQNSEDQAAKGRHHHTLRTHCPHGHEYSDGNTYVSKSGFRSCITCQRIRFRIKAGWPESLARITPVVPKGHRVINRLGL